MNKLNFAKTGASLLLTTLSGAALASGFQLLEQNASGMGTAYAGSAAIAEDASTVFFNPAGMALLAPGKSHVAIGLDFIQPSAKFSNSGSVGPGVPIPPTYTISLGSNNGGDAGGMNYVPHAYLVTPLSERISFGLGLGAPFGLKTEYDSDWIGRFQAIKSDIKTMNLNPSISYKLNDQVALGFGLDYQKLQGEFTSAVNFPGAIFKQTNNATLANMSTPGAATLSGSDTDWGYNLGVVYQVSPQTRLGMSYRSETKYHLTGGAAFNYSPISGKATGAPAPLPLYAQGVDASIKAGSRDIYADIKLPDTLIFSVDHHLNDQWDLLADLSWTGWGKIPMLEFKYANNNTIVSKTQENFKNTWRAALGGVYKYSDSWKLKLGTAYDQSPVSDDYRTARLPDNDRLWLSCGAQYRLGKDGAIDFGYTHIIVKNSSIKNNGYDAGAYGLLQGTYKNKVDMFGVQYSRGF